MVLANALGMMAPLTMAIGTRMSDMVMVALPLVMVFSLKVSGSTMSNMAKVCSAIKMARPFLAFGRTIDSMD